MQTLKKLDINSSIFAKTNIIMQSLKKKLTGDK